MSLRKKLYLALAAVVLIGIGYMIYIMATTRSISPAAVVTFQQNDIDIRIDYCQPYKKGRTIFGSREDGALLPPGVYWRLGANEATKLTLGGPITFGGQVLEAGSYSLYAFPHEDNWVIGINSDANRWGATTPDFSKDLGRVKVPTILSSQSLEQFTISIEPEGEHAVVVMQWDRTLVEIPLKAGN